MDDEKLRGEDLEGPFSQQRRPETRISPFLLTALTRAGNHRRRVQSFPGGDRSYFRIGGEQSLQKRRSGALEAGNDDGRIDILRKNLRVAGDPILRSQPVFQYAEHA